MLKTINTRIDNWLIAADLHKVAEDVVLTGLLIALANGVIGVVAAGVWYAVTR